MDDLALYTLKDLTSILRSWPRGRGITVKVFVSRTTMSSLGPDFVERILRSSSAWRKDLAHACVIILLSVHE